MDAKDLLTEAYDRLPGLVEAAVRGLTPQQLRQVPAPGANPVGWLVWHLTRIQDHHVADLLGAEQVWVSGDRAGRFGLAPDPDDTGFGHGPEQIVAVRPESAQALVDYHRAVAERTGAYLRGLRPVDLDRVVDENWDPPVTLGVRLVSVLEDDLQHAGQAAYVRGLVERG
ncbi:DinB family protein [Micromonospora sp. R77]|uniref:mycothiol transferase n=1 Tax=Micromonospora sp. R77 TaxID=2925836 RepID=UPI001F607922|nr:DinB family protein [Micromonospora sp. R77]MCI4065167.1 DinB family protein [Micromonospora sp. R77]